MFSTPKEKKTDELGPWFTLSEMHRAFDISAQAFSKSVRPLLAPDDVRGDGTRGIKIDCRAQSTHGRAIRPPRPRPTPRRPATHC